MNVPKLRFKEFDGEWTNVSLDSIVERVVRKNKQLESKLPLTISADIGLVDQITYFNKNVAGKDLSGYYLLKKGEFAYNKSYSNGYPWGAIKQLENYNQGLLSTLYICFKAMNINEVFLKHYFETNHWHKEVSMIAAEGARNHGLLNIPVNEFFKIKLNIPEEWEQRKIGNLFEKIDKKIQLQQQKIDLLQEQKKGYMQKIFNIDLNRELNSNLNFEWKETKVGNIVSSFSGGTPSITNKNYYNGEIPFIRSGELHSHTTELFLSEEGLEKSSAKLVQEGDLLYALYGATSGEVEISKIAGAINQAILCLRPKEDNKYFLRYWLEYKKDYILKTYLQGGQGNLSASIIKSLNIYLPSHERQENIAIFFLQLDERINFEKEKKILLQKQKQGFMQQMFI